MESTQPVKKTKKSPAASEKKRKDSSSKSETKPKRRKVSELEKETTGSQGAAALNITETSAVPRPIDPTPGLRDSVEEKPVATEAAGQEQKKSRVLELAKDMASVINVYEGLNCPAEDKIIREEPFDPRT